MLTVALLLYQGLGPHWGGTTRLCNGGSAT